MTSFTPAELNMICLYNPGTRVGAIYELRDMMSYLMPDEEDLEIRAKSVIAKLERMTDDEYFDLVEDLDVYFPEGEYGYAYDDDDEDDDAYDNEDAGYGVYRGVWDDYGLYGDELDHDHAEFESYLSGLYRSPDDGDLDFDEIE